MQKLYPEETCPSDHPLARYLIESLRGIHPIFVSYVEAGDEHNLTNLDEARALVVEATVNYIKKYEL